MKALWRSDGLLCKPENREGEMLEQVSPQPMFAGTLVFTTFDMNLNEDNAMLRLESEVIWTEKEANRVLIS